MLNVAERAKGLIETKTIRRVRTEAGVRRYKQPIGSIIINDALVVGLTDMPSSLKNVARMKGDNGKIYTVHSTGRAGSYNQRHYLEEDGVSIGEYRDELEAYATASERVKADMGWTGGGQLNTGGKRQGFSKNQAEAASAQISSWGNTATDTGNDRVAYALWDIAGDLDQHGDLRLARHQLEQLKRRDDLNLDDHLDGNPDDTTYRELINSASVDVRTEGKLPKRYDEESEAAYAADAQANIAATANQPKPIKTSEIGEGMWVRKLDKDGNATGDWFKVRAVADQSTSGRSKLIRGTNRRGSNVNHYRQGPRDKWETIADPKDQPAYVSREEREGPTNVTKRIHHLDRGDYTTVRGTDSNGNPVTDTGYVTNYAGVDKDDYSSPERRKNPVYKVELADDKAGTQNPRTVLVPRGSVTGPQEEAPAEPKKSRLQGGKGWSYAESEYEGYQKYQFDDGRVFYSARANVGTVNIYDENDKIVAVADNNPRHVHQTIDRLAAQPAPSDETGYDGLKVRPSEYDGYSKYVHDNGSVFYGTKEDGKTVIYDAEDNELFRGGVEEAMDFMAAGGTTSQAEVPTQPWGVPGYPNLQEAVSEYDDYEKYIGSNGEDFYMAREGRTWKVYDRDDNLLMESSGAGARRTMLETMQMRAAEASTPAVVQEAPAATPEPTATALKRLKSKFDGWKRYKLPDGRVVDTGLAVDDDNRWYATGKGGWDEIIADGDSEDEMMAKLRAIAAPSDTPVSFSPGNTDVVPAEAPKPKRKLKRDLVPGVERQYTDEESKAKAEELRRRWWNSDSPTQRALVGNPMTPEELARVRNAKAGAGKTRPSRDFWKGGDADKVPFKDAEVERQEEIAERDRDNAMIDAAKQNAAKAVFDKEINNAMREIRADRKSVVRDNTLAKMETIRNQVASGLMTPDEGVEGIYRLGAAYPSSKVTAVGNRLRGAMRSATETPGEARERIIASTAKGNTIDIKPGSAAEVGQPRKPGPILGPAEPGLAALAINSETEYNVGNGILSTMEQTDLNNLARGLREGAITTPEAAHALDRMATFKRGEGRGNVALVYDNIRENIMSHDQRSREQIREDAKAKRAAVAARPAVENMTPDQRLAALSALEPVARNNKPLGAADRRMLNLEGSNRQARPGRLIPPSNANLNNRLGRLTQNDAEAYQALEDRATNNYLEGMTHAAAWKEAITTAESISVPEFYVMQEGTRNGYGQHVVYRRNGDGTRSEVMTFSGSQYRDSWKQREMANGRASQERIKARNAATRSVPVTGAPGTQTQPENAPAATTAASVNTPEARAAEVQANAVQQYEQMVTDGGWIHVSELRQKLDSLGYSKAEQDDAFLKLSRSGTLNFAPDPDRMRISSDRRINGIEIGGEMNHLVARGNSAPVTSTSPIRGSALDALSIDERLDNLRQFTVSGPNYSRTANEYSQRVRDNVRKGEGDYAIGNLLRAEAGAGLRPTSDVDNYWNELSRPQVEKARAENRETSIANQAANIDEAGARRLAREDPARFMRVVGYRYFKQGKDLRKKENARDKEAYDEMNAFADEIENGAATGRTMDAVQGVLLSMKLRYSGMIGIGRTMMTIRSVLDKENR